MVTCQLLRPVTAVTAACPRRRLATAHASFANRVNHSTELRNYGPLTKFSYETYDADTRRNGESNHTKLCMYLLRYKEQQNI